ncbi:MULTISPECIES: HesA/MoeB/ThiF family protein [unclassified Brevundimonas]|uniref:HesA/MoeB/ThiF family protein n=1 Tax=unclassified Brevundimonas TaxID=2622653 RepID=UPI000C483C97|nr:MULTISPECIES: molybdopterin-synthase adenylyltransferase MoeB [unclassified Brevundimonas]MAL89600.1 molybdopterin biosynthesis protein MoeB [Brevundimonas sp.]HAJ02635.1 molybdopterin biosynthesis protein MoeB [Brevundimonas sp.]HAV49557.1 molybdopterin biosynthesis protein MoeB [Brevundimonas sp.]
MTFSEDEIERYARHLVLADVGGPGQQRLKAARVLIVGMGGVGGPAALYLAAAGVGILGLVDDDTVSLSNLQRQIQFETADIGRPKVEVAARRLTALNPHVEVRTFAERLSADTAHARITGWDLVIDGTDDFATRMAVNAACITAGVPLVSGALGAWSGQVAVFKGRPCYRCLVPDVPPDAETCARVGVVGALAGLVGSMTALETLKRLTGAGEPLTGRLWIHDALTGQTRTVRIAADPACPVCS